MPNLPDPVIAALIAASMALLGLIVSATIALFTWRTSQKVSQQQLKHAELLAAQQMEFQGKMALWSVKAGPWQEKLSRLNDLQRVAERTRDLAIGLNEVQRLLNNRSSKENGNSGDDIFMDYAGRFIVAAGRLFADPPTGISNLPDSSVEPLKGVRRAVLRVNLLLELPPTRMNGHGSTLDAAVNQLRDAVGEFTQCVAREEDELTPKNLIGPRKNGAGPHATH